MNGLIEADDGWSGVRLPKYGLLTQVGPKQGLLDEVCVQSHDVPLLLHDLRVLLPLQTQAADIPAVGEDQARLLT